MLTLSTFAVSLWLVQEPSVILWSECVAFITVPLFREVLVHVRKYELVPGSTTITDIK